MLPSSAARKEILLGRGITLEPVPQERGTVFEISIGILLSDF